MILGYDHGDLIDVFQTAAMFIMAATIFWLVRRDK